MRILVVEDDARMARLLEQGLTEEGHAVATSGDGVEGLSMASSGDFDLLILDIMLPRLDGLGVVKSLRARRIQTPVLMLTARDTSEDIVAGLNLGADDYLTKPFSFEVLFARVRSVARRGPIARPMQLAVADLAIDIGTREVTRGSRSLALSRTEYSLLEALARNAGHVVTRASLMDQVWGAGADVESNTLDVFIRLLRAKVDRPGEPRLIQTIRGFGYALRREEP